MLLAAPRGGWHHGTGKGREAGGEVLSARPAARRAALWIGQGLSPKRVQTLMGHASIAQTFDQYGYLFEARDDETAMMAGVENGLL